MAFIKKKASEAIKATKGLDECPICLKISSDPRILPCWHTFCLKCLVQFQFKNNKKPGDALPCPLCRTQFIIPPAGMNGLQMNFFVENLMKITRAINLKDEKPLCKICSAKSRPVFNIVSKATKTCLNCWENYCSRCSEMHTSQKLAQGHIIVEINRALSDDDIRDMFPTRNCQKHSDNVLNFYCEDCKAVVCVSCFVEDHQNHKCKDVKSVDKAFRRRLEENCAEVSAYRELLASKKMDIDRENAQLQARLLETENKIKIKSDQMKALIDQHTQHLLDELSLMRRKHEKTIKIEIEEFERQMTVLESFVAFCTEMKSKGSASEVCGSAENLITRSGELKERLDQYLNAPSKSVDIEFSVTNEKDLLKSGGNFIGKLSESVKHFQRHAIVVGREEGSAIFNEVIKVNLNQPEDVSNLQPVPTEMKIEAAAAVYCNSIFITGIGKTWNEIWKYEGTYCSWKQCASLIRRRSRHSVAFVNHVLYICGGYVGAHNRTLDDVEAYDAINNASASVGKLSYAVMSAGGCVSFKDSLYIFGGLDVNNKFVNSVQMFDTKSNICSLLSKPMPPADALLRPVLWNNTVILLCAIGCFIYNFDTEIWHVSDRFKTEVDHFGLTIANGKMFVIGGGTSITDADGKRKWNCRDEVRSVPIWNILNDKPIAWRHHAKLSKPSMVCAFGKMKIFVQV